jgi:energy-coupling factor transport system substrate-specific component
MSVEQHTGRSYKGGPLERLRWRGGRPWSTREVATIAILAALGGVMSAYVGYLGVLLNKLVGTPFGAGQFLAGLHVLWMVLAVVMTNRVGAATSTGLLKGTVEMLAGSSKGVLVILLSLVAGLIVDAVWALAPRRGMHAAVMAGALATCSNVVMFLLFTSTYAGLLWLFLLLMAVSFVSGVIFAGLLVWNIAATLDHAGIMVRAPGLEPGSASADPPVMANGGTRERTWRSMAGIIVTIVVVVLLFGGALAYYVATVDDVASMREGTVSVEGDVGTPYEFHLDEFEDGLVTVEAELEGEFTHVPMREYTGVPLARILERAAPGDDATLVRVVGADGYGEQLALDLEDVTDPASEEDYLLVEEQGTLSDGGSGDYYRMVCRDLDGGWWVRWVVRVIVE